MNSKKVKNTNVFEENLENFIKNINSLKRALHLTMGLIEVSHKVNQSKLAHFIKKNGKNVTNKSFKIKHENRKYFEELKNDTNISKASLRIVPRSISVSLISEFDFFIGIIIRNIILLNPEILNNCEKNVNFSALTNFKNINEAKNYIIEKEVESVLRESHTFHFEWIEKKLNMSLRKDLSIWHKFVEITERRNLFVHCGGIIGSQYVAICKQSGVKLSHEYAPGLELGVSPQYLDDICNCLIELGVKLTHVIWRKLKPNELSKADDNLNKICYDLIDRQSFALADVLLDFSTDVLKKHASDVNKNVFIINKALSRKLGGNKEDAFKIINSWDWSASSNDFKLAKEIILENYEAAFLIMKKIGKDGEFISKAGYRDWPLFREVKKNKKFKELFKKIYKEEYELKENNLEYDLTLTVKPKKKATKK
ncbi:MAG: hypothetical protein HGB08_02890 [Candidatus Moranbacteria bacterium]|nr:hypothetical protein [Candidatus Moranbacteria bacterium]